MTGHASTSVVKEGLPTTRPESRTRFALCGSAVYIQQSRARVTLPDLATVNREFTWVDTPDLKYSRDAKISYIPPCGPIPATSIRKRTEHEGGTSMRHVSLRALPGCILLLAHLAVAGTPNRVTILYDSFGKPPILTMDWGFAALVEYGGKRILF